MSNISNLHALPTRDKGDAVCTEADGCPTEKAVLQRFWRAHHSAVPVGYVWESVALDLQAGRMINGTIGAFPEGDGPDKEIALYAAIGKS